MPWSTSTSQALLGTYGGSILFWDFATNKLCGKMAGHLSSCTKLKAKHDMIVSGAVDTNIKMWDMRMK